MTHEEDTKVLLHSAAESYRAGPPPVAELLRLGKRARKRRRLVVAGGSAVAVAAVATGGFALTPHVGTGAVPVVGTTPTQEDTSFDLDSIKGLTGKDVGDALGLTPWDPEGEEIQACDGMYAEYSDPPGDDNAAGFCLAGITEDPVEEHVIALQVVGYEQTATVKAAAAALVKLDNHRGNGTEHAELMRKVAELMKQVDAQGQADDS